MSEPVLTLRALLDEHAPALAGLRDDVRKVLAAQIAVCDQQRRDLLDEREIAVAIGVTLEDRAARIAGSHALGGVERERHERSLQADELVVAAILSIGALFARLPLPRPAWATGVPAYAIGVVGMFWVAERVASF